VPFESTVAAAWDLLVRAAPMGTLLHTRAFLSYHGERFEDASVMLHNEGGELVGVLPAAADPTGGERVVSHPGATFGGIVHDGKIRGAAMLEGLAAAAKHYRQVGFGRLIYAPVPHIYHRRPSSDDLYALARFGALRTCCNLSCAINLETGPCLSSRRRRGLRKAHKEGVTVAQSPELLDDLWSIVEVNLAERHDTRPVHTKAEVGKLMALFPEEIVVTVAHHEGEPVGGVLVFESPKVSHAQYIASTTAGNRVGALDAVFDCCLSRATARGARFFDFGTSNRDGGWVLNEGLYEFKAQFGGGGVAYEVYEMDLRAISR